MNKKLIYENNNIMKIRFIIYGLSGFCAEILFTGFFSLVRGDMSLTGHTYLWMFFIYGLAVFMEPVHNKIRHLPFYIRGGIYTILIFSIEFITGMLLKTIIGICPWDYSARKFQVLGVINLAYTPIWFVLGLLFELYHDFLINIEKKITKKHI